MTDEYWWYWVRTTIQADLVQRWKIACTCNMEFGLYIFSMFLRLKQLNLGVLQKFDKSICLWDLKRCSKAVSARMESLPSKERSECFRHWHGVVKTHLHHNQTIHPIDLLVAGAVPQIGLESLVGAFRLIFSLRIIKSRRCRLEMESTLDCQPKCWHKQWSLISDYLVG